MRVLTSLNIGYPVVGGAQITHQTYLRQWLLAMRHTTFYLDTARARCGCRAVWSIWTRFATRRNCARKVEHDCPDVLIAGFTLIHDAVKLGHALGIPVVGWMNSYEYCPPTIQEVEAWQLTHSHRYPAPDERAFALQHADRLVVNSHLLQARLERTERTHAQVIYPAFDKQSLLFAPRSYEPQFILGVCGYPHKGADIFLELARHFSREHFVLAGAVHVDYYQKFRALENVTLVPFTPIRELLRNTKLLLVPSQWDEPFGRIALEGMANEIPTLVSRAAGLQEIVGENEQGVRLYQDPAAWQAAVEGLLAQPARLRANGECGLEIAARWLTDEPIRQLDALLRELLARSTPRAVATKHIVLVGDTQAATAFAMINEQLRARLLRTGYDVQVTAQPDQFVPA